ncbi:phosphatidylglycerol lysyltransferase domain-containing protein [Hamadaea sp. NPDC050747]|uniref:phosphatidylglycerol lysyltransferase domain-containing protein n=1 Tax=Hamadaea sp. NPDC050747 TaxID=3155789 RepID=UPI0033E729D7
MPDSRDSRRRSETERRPPARVPSSVRWTARFLALAGVVDLLTVLLPPARYRLSLLTEVVPLTGVQTARAATAAVGLLLIYLSVGLRRRTREAWFLAVALALVSTALNVLKGLDLDAAAISAGLLAALLGGRRDYCADAGRTSRWRALAALAGFGGAGLAFGVAEIGVRSRALEPGQSPRLWVIHAAEGMVGVTGPLRFTRPAVADAVSLTTGTMGLLAVAVALVLLLRPLGRRPGHTPVDVERIGRLLASHGHQDSLGYFALRPDKSVIWSPTGKAGVAYRVIWGVSLASGDPIGDPEAWPGAVEAWLADCRRNRWTPAVLGCGERAGLAYARQGLNAIELGDEALVDVDAFSLDGRSMRAVRQAVGRVERAGYTCQLARQRDLPREVLAEARRACHRLRDGDVERGFSMALSRVGDPADGDCLLVLARDAEGRLRGLLQFVPWGPDGLSLDLMRRDRAADNGLIEYMVVTVLRQAATLGVSRVSLNFAVLRSVFARGDRLGAGPVLRLWYHVLMLASRYWQLESLYRANAKYSPTWQPRYLCYPSMADLPRIGLVALRAEAFLTLPQIRRTPSVVETGERVPSWS